MELATKRRFRKLADPVDRPDPEPSGAHAHGSKAAAHRTAFSSSACML
jgi:hypothetical protein